MSGSIYPMKYIDARQEKAVNRIVRILCAVLTLGVGAAAQAEIRVKDAFDREIVLTKPAAHIAPAGPPAEVLLYIVAPDLMAGWARKQPDATLAKLDTRARALPVLGHLTGWEGEPNYKVWTDAKVDLFVDYGSINGRFEALAETTQKATGIPYVVLDGALEKTPEALRLIGRLTGREDHAEILAKTAERLLARAAAQNTAKKPAIYIARSADGRSTIAARSQHGQIYLAAGAANPAVREDQITDAELTAWKPDVMIALTDGFMETIKSAPWTNLPAVKNARVYTAPFGPWSWMSGPPSVNRLLGLAWLSAALAEKPDWAATDAETQALYELFYQAR